MATYLVGTDGEPASTAIGDHLAGRLAGDDHVRAVYVRASANEAARRALAVLEDRLGDEASVETAVVDPGQERGPADTLVDEAEAADADQLVVGLRRHSRAERLIKGSVSHALVEQVDLPLLLVPLAEA